MMRKMGWKQAACGLVMTVGAGFVGMESSSAIQDEQTIPQELLDVAYKDCETGCLQSFDGVTCEKFCKCSVGEFQKRMDYGTYLDFHLQLSQGSLSDQNRTMLDSIGQFCAATVETPAAPAVTPPPGR